MTTLFMKSLPTFEEASAKPHEYLYVRKIKPMCIQIEKEVGDELICAVLDVETTGLEQSCDIIELGAVKVHYSPSVRRITRIDSIFNQLEQPTAPIPPEATAVNGITDEDVEGHKFNEDEIFQYFENVEYVVSHNAKFDRPFFDSRLPDLADLPWVCSLRDIKWRELGYSSGALEFLGYKHGFAYEAHRASSDAFATALLLAQRPEYLNYLLEALNAIQYKICAFGSPYETKDSLKKRGYDWDDMDRYWHITVGSEEDKHSELDFLEDLYGGCDSAGVTLVDASTRFAKS